MPHAIHGNSSTEFLQFLEEKRRVFRAMGEERIVDAPDFEAAIRTQWQHWQEVKRRTGRREQASSTRKAPREIISVTKRGLKAAGFNSRRPFSFHNDPKEQDERTTWIEYLRFECWWQDTCGDRATQLGEADNAGGSDQEAGQYLITSPGDLKTRRPRLGRTRTTDPRAELHPSFEEAQLPRDGAKDPETMPGAQIPRNSRESKRIKEYELQQRRLEWIVAQLASIEANTHACFGLRSTTKRKRADEDKIEDKDAMQAEGLLRKKRNINAKKTR